MPFRVPNLGLFRLQSPAATANGTKQEHTLQTLYHTSYISYSHQSPKAEHDGSNKL